VLGAKLQPTSHGLDKYHTFALFSGQRALPVVSADTVLIEITMQNAANAAENGSRIARPFNKESNAKLKAGIADGRVNEHSHALRLV
jgi:hypothetical protein